MTMVPLLRRFIVGRTVCRKQDAGRVLAAVIVLFGVPGVLGAQVPKAHYRHSGDMPPGAIGRWQLRRGGPLPGYFQPVEIRAPRGALVSLAADGRFDSPQAAPRKAGFLIGSVYRLRVTQIPDHPGLEVFPSVELIDRTYPPPGEELRFPIPIELTVRDLLLAADGKFVIRVIYLENPRNALQIAEEPGKLDWFEAPPNDDPLQLADGLGRPVALVRLGARHPARTGPDANFLFGSPPMMRYQNHGP